jgi:hypothetical protein
MVHKCLQSYKVSRTYITITYWNAESVECIIMKSYAEYEAGYYRESLLIYVYNDFKTTTETEVRTKIMEMWSFFRYSLFVKKGSQCELGNSKVNSKVHQFFDRMTMHRNRFLVNKTNRCTEIQFYWYYYSTCFGQHFCPSSGVLSRTSVLVHFMQFWWTVCYQE